MPNAPPPVPWETYPCNKSAPDLNVTSTETEVKSDWCFVPVHFGEPAIETGLVGGDGKLPVDGRNIFLVGDHQAGEVLSEVLTLWLIFEMIPKFIQSFPDDGWKFYDSGHDRILHDSVTLPAINIYRQNTHLESNFSTLQNFSY